MNANTPKPQTTDNEVEHNGITFEVVEEETINGKKIRNKGVYLVPNLITSLSVLSAVFSLTLGASGNFKHASLAIFVSAFLDGMDGRAARLLNAQSPFGEQYDSLADMVAFGLAPAMLAYHFALKELGQFGVVCAFVYVACAAFRLARFNVQIGVVDKKYFIGVASPLAAILVASSIMVSNKYLKDVANLEWAYAIWVVIIGLLMVSNLKYYSFKEFDKKKVPFVVLMLAVLLVGIVANDVPLGLLGIGIIYALSGVIGAIFRKN